MHTAAHSLSIVEKANTLKTLAQDILQQAKALGASEVETSLQITAGFDVKIRLGEVDTVSFNRDQEVAIEVYYGKRKGAASSSDLSPESIAAAVKMACEIAQVTQEDPYSGLADAEDMATHYPDLDLYHHWDLDVPQAILLATACEDYARAYDKKITNSEGASLASHDAFSVYANSHGFIGAYPSSHHGLSCGVIAQQGQEMQRDYWYTNACDAQKLQNGKEVGELAAQRTLEKLGSRRMSTGEVPVIFAAEVASSLLSNFIAAISGGNLYRHASFLCDHLNKKIFPKFVHIYEAPHIPGALGSSPFDADGLATSAKDFITEGILRSYVLSTYSARRLHLKSTGNAGGVHNLMIDTSPLGLTELFKEMGRGLYVTDLMGQGVNLITGDYSRGVAGFWIEHGEIQFPIHEVTIAGNLREMFASLVAIGNDIDKRGNILTGSIWLDKMMVAGE